MSGFSSRTTLAIDAVVAQTVDEYAPSIYAALQRLNAAEPVVDPAKRRDQLRELLREQLTILGNLAKGVRDNVGMSGRRGPYSGPSVTQTEAATARAISQFVGQIGLDVTTQANSQSAPAQVVHSPVFHAPVGNYQAGDRNTATVTQSVVTQVSPGEVKAALDALIQALQHAQGLAPDQRAEVVEVLEQVKAEADKDKPNKLKLGGLIGGVADTVQGIAAAPEAWATVTAWYEIIKNAIA